MAHHSGYINAGVVLKNAAAAVGDPDANIVRKPVYMAFIQETLMEMCHDVPFSEKIYDAAIPESRIVDAPKWMAGVKMVGVYNGTKCAPSTLFEVYRRENYHHHGGAGFARNTWDNLGDPMKPGFGGGASTLSEPMNLRYYGYMDEKFQLSPACSGFEWLRVVYSGLGFDHYCGDEEELLIPTWAQAAITDRVIHRAAELRQHEEGKTMLMRDIVIRKDKEYKEPTGSWFRAMGRWGSMDDKERSDSILTMSRMGYGGESMF